jgi:Protein of unknown function (DUF3703)
VTNIDLPTAYRHELSAGYASLEQGDHVEAMRRFERSHILGQRKTRLHVRAHVAMLKVGWQRRDTREVLGQLTRIIAAALFSRIWVPEGNTGGAKVSALKPMPVPDDLKRILELLR